MGAQAENKQSDKRAGARAFDFRTDEKPSVNELLLVNMMPAPTWHKLKVNGSHLYLDGLQSSAAVSSEQDSEESEVSNLSSGVDFELNGVVVGEAGAFDEALISCKTFSKPAKNSRAVETAAQGRADAQDLDYPALSAYQKRAVLLELDGSPAAYFETGMGRAANEAMTSANAEAITLIANAGAKSSATIYVPPARDFSNCVCVDLIARKNSECEITIVYEDAAVDSEVRAEAAENNAAASSTSSTPLVAGCTLRVFASANARVNVNTVQALTQNVVVLDNSGYSLCSGAKVSVDQRVLGGAKTYTGLAADLHGDASAIDVSTKYIGQGTQEHDFTYTIKQRGRNTKSNMSANGILAGSSKKTLRGTIDFVHGSKGSVGSESETVLLASDGAQADTNLNNAATSGASTGINAGASSDYTVSANSSGDAHNSTQPSPDQPTCKSVPVILCDEEDVSGNHGATIGHVKPETRFYLHTRGLSDAQIEQLFLSAYIEDALTKYAHDPRTTSQTESFSHVVLGFS